MLVSGHGVCHGCADSTRYGVPMSLSLQASGGVSYQVRLVRMTAGVSGCLRVPRVLVLCSVRTAQSPRIAPGGRALRGWRSSRSHGQSQSKPPCLSM
jgi:hypothetical protein